MLKLYLLKYASIWSSSVQLPGRHEEPKNCDSALIFFSNSVIGVLVLQKLLSMLSIFDSNSSKINLVAPSSYLKPGWHKRLLLSPSKLPAYGFRTSTTVWNGSFSKTILLSELLIVSYFIYTTIIKIFRKFIQLFRSFETIITHLNRHSQIFSPNFIAYVFYYFKVITSFKSDLDSGA